jgi:cytochrome b
LKRGPAMSRVIVWSLSARVLHFAFAGSLAAALVLGFGVDDENPLFAYHMLAGIFAAGALGLRLVLGVLGGRHERFRDWPFGSAAFGRFFRGLRPGAADEEFAGHNPPAAWVMVAMFAVTAVLVWTGLDGGEDLHEGLAWGLVALIGAHLAGLAAHTVWRGENIALAMFDGRKRVSRETGRTGHGLVGGVVVAGLLAAWGAVLWRGFDAGEGRLRLPGLAAPIRLGDTGEGHGTEREHHHEGGRHGED